jgi:quercetin dioxygenase-like cupin family protein
VFLHVITGMQGNNPLPILKDKVAPFGAISRRKRYKSNENNLPHTASLKKSQTPPMNNPFEINQDAMAFPTHAVVLPSDYTSKNTPEKFDDPNRGECTWHTLPSQPNTATNSMCAGIAVCLPRTGRLCSHRHEQAEIYYIISGKGIMTIDGEKYHVECGSSVFVPGNAEHGIVNDGEEELRWFYVFPTMAFSNVVYRFSEEVAVE